MGTIDWHMDVSWGFLHEMTETASTPRHSSPGRKGQNRQLNQSKWTAELNRGQNDKKDTFGIEGHELRAMVIVADSLVIAGKGLRSSWRGRRRRWFDGLSSLMLLSERHFCGLFAWSISPRSVSILMDLCVFNIFLLKLVIAIALSVVQPM